MWLRHFGDARTEDTLVGMMAQAWLLRMRLLIKRLQGRKLIFQHRIAAGRSVRSGKFLRRLALMGPLLRWLVALWLVVCCGGWVLVSREGRVTLLGALDIDPTRSGMQASVVFKQKSSQQWVMRYETGEDSFTVANRDDRQVLTLYQNGMADLDGTSFTVGKRGVNQSMIIVGRTSPWRLAKSTFRGTGESMFELTDPMNRPRIRAHRTDGVEFFSWVSIKGVTTMGSALSVYGPWLRLGGYLSVLKHSFLGSSLLLRGYARCGSTLALLRLARFGLLLVLSNSASPGTTPVTRSSS